MKWQQIRNAITSFRPKSVASAGKSLSPLPYICTDETTDINAPTNVTEQKEGTMESTDEITLKKENHPTCRRCGRKLKNEESKLLGFGPLCYRRHMAEQARRPLFEVRKHEQSRT